ncbi:MAG: hypothetical protein V7752_12130 [Halopseudomonas sp.]
MTMFSSAYLQPCHYLKLEGPDFLSHTQPLPLISPQLFHLNQPFVSELGLDPADFTPDNFANHLSQAPLPDHLKPFLPPIRGISLASSTPRWVMAGRC